MIQANYGILVKPITLRNPQAKYTLKMFHQKTVSYAVVGPGLIKYHAIYLITTDDVHTRS